MKSHDMTGSVLHVVFKAHKREIVLVVFHDDDKTGI